MSEIKKDPALEKAGIVFEGGGMRAVFDTGVIDWLLKAEIFIPTVYGVSAGIGHAENYVTRQVGRGYASSTDFAGDPQFAGLNHFRKTGDFFDADFICHEIPQELYPLDNDVYKESDSVLHAVVTNCETGEAEYPILQDLFDDAEYIHASGALPFMMNMVEINGNKYLDGGIADSIPVRHALESGCKKVVCVLTQPRDYEKAPAKLVPTAMKVKYRGYPKLIEAMEKRAEVYNNTLAYIREQEEAGRVFVIAPLGKIEIGRAEMDREKLRKTYNEGYYIAEGLGAKLRAFLGIS